jgi:hypothetical protein
MAAKGGQVDAMQLSTRVVELEVRKSILWAPPRVLAQATRCPIVAQRAAEGASKRRKGRHLRRRWWRRRRGRVKVE